MTTAQVQSLLIELFDLLDEFPTDVDRAISCVRTFADADILTRDSGVVVTAADGSEFQVTIVRSR